VVRSNHNERIVRINLALMPILIGFELGRLRLFFLLLSRHKEDEERYKKEEDALFCLQEYWLSLFGYKLSVCLLSVFPHESSYKLEIEMWKNVIGEYHEDEKQYLDVLSCNFFADQNTCDLMIYSTID
jgi:hypothetical protein